MSTTESKTKKWLGRIKGKIKSGGSRGSVALEPERPVGTSPILEPEPPPSAAVPASHSTHVQATRFSSPPAAPTTHTQNRSAMHSVQAQPSRSSASPHSPSPNPSFRQSLQVQPTQSQPLASPAIQGTQAPPPNSRQSPPFRAAPSTVLQKSTPHNPPLSQPQPQSQHPAYEPRGANAKPPPLAQSDPVHILRPPPSATFLSNIQPKSLPPESSLKQVPSPQPNTKAELRVTEPLSEHDLEDLLSKHGFLDRYKDTPRTCDGALCKAAAAGEERLVQDLLDAGVPIISSSLRTAIQASRPDTLVSPTSSALHVTIRREQVRVARRLLNHWWLMVCIPSSQGIAAGLARKVQVEKMAELLNLFDDGNRTPLNVAAEVGSTEIVTELLDRGASIDIPDYLGRTPLHQAARCGRLGVVKILVDRGAEISWKDNQGRSVTDRATSNGHFDIVQLLEQAARAKILKMPKERERKVQEERERVERVDKKHMETGHMVREVKDVKNKARQQTIPKQTQARTDLLAKPQELKNVGLDNHGLPTLANESLQWEVFKEEFAQFRSNSIQGKKHDQVTVAAAQHQPVEIQVLKSDSPESKATDGWDDGFVVMSYRAVSKRDTNTARRTEDTTTSAAPDWDEPFQAVGYKVQVDNGVSKTIVGGNDLVQVMREQHVSAGLAAAAATGLDESSRWDADSFPVISYRMLKPTTTSTETPPIQSGTDGEDSAVSGTPNSAPPRQPNQSSVGVPAAPTRRVTSRPLESWLDTNMFATATTPSTSTLFRFSAPPVSARGQLPADSTSITSPASPTSAPRPPRVSLNERPYIPPSRYRSELERRIEEKRLRQFQGAGGLTEGEIMRWD